MSFFDNNWPNKSLFEFVITLERISGENNFFRNSRLKTSTGIPKLIC